MTAKEIREKFDLKVFCEETPDAEVLGGYTGDLLSWVMGRSEKGNCWITIMSNRNVSAVAQLTEASMVILAEDVEPDQGTLDAFIENGLNLYGSSESAFSISGKVAILFHEQV